MRAELSPGVLRNYDNFPETWMQGLCQRAGVASLSGLVGGFAAHRMAVRWSRKVLMSQGESGQARICVLPSGVLTEGSYQNMIDGKLRSELSQEIRRLATGRMTNDAFDDRYYEVYECADDRAVNEIARFCYGLYSSDLLLPMRLRGRYALDAETKRTIARCVLFLRSGHEYGWPPLPDHPAARLLAGLSFSLGFPGGVAITLIGLLMAVVDAEPFAFVLLAIGLPMAAVCLYVGFFRSTVSLDEWRRYMGFGDYDCWPFLRRESFESARKQNFLLGH